MKYNKNIIDALLLNAFLDSQGIYPQTIIDKDGNRKERTTWQDGWNACHIQIRNNVCVYDKWLENLSPQEQEDCTELLVQDIIKLSVRNNLVQIWLLMNDIFEFACADGEDISPNDFGNILAIYRRYGWDGLVAWVVIKRNTQPLNELITIEYLAAFKEISINSSKRIYNKI